MATLYPRAFLSLGGGANIPCLSATVERKAKRAGDTFTAELAIQETALYGMDLNAWADFQPVQVQILLSTAPGGADLAPMITGMIDTPEIDWLANKVSINGRDLTASLIETRRSQKFSSQASSDIASQVATDNGLQPQVQSTGSYAGKQYVDGDVNHLVIHRTDFEVMNDLADREGYEWFVDGETLLFQPPGQGAANIYSVTWTPPGLEAPYGIANVMSLKTGRNMTAAKPHSVNVKSWHSMQKQQYTGAAQASGVGNQINIDHHHNGKTQDQANTLAMSRATDAIRHELEVSITAPIDLTVDPKTTQLTLSGTGTIYDQTYDIDAATFTVAWGEGGEMQILAKAASQGRTVSQGGGDNSDADAAADDPVST